MDIEFFEKIKRIALISLFSDDDLMDILVLKGANALNLIYNVTSRSSIDLDFSIENDFNKEDLSVIKEKIEKVLKETFKANGYQVFDVSFVERPARISSNMINFWGGYQIEFKIIETDKYKLFINNHDALRRNAIVVTPNEKKKFKIDISKFEYCQEKKELEIDGYTIYVYSPEMIIFEKLRAICQQMPEYSKIVKSQSQSARAKDFFDIYLILEKWPLNLNSESNIKLMKSIFEAKKVPLKLIKKIPKYKEYHEHDFTSVRDTVKSNITLKDFDFYFNYVVDVCSGLKIFREI